MAGRSRGQASRAADESAAVEFIFASESLKTVAQVARAGAGATGDTWRRLGASASSAQRVWLACRFARLFVCLRRRVLPWRAVLSTLNRRRRHDESRRARRGSKHCFPSCWKAPLGKALPQVIVHTTRRSVESMQQPLPVWDGRRRGGQTRTYYVRSTNERRTSEGASFGSPRMMQRHGKPTGTVQRATGTGGVDWQRGLPGLDASVEVHWSSGMSILYKSPARHPCRPCPPGNLEGLGLPRVLDCQPFPLRAPPTLRPSIHLDILIRIHIHIRIPGVRSSFVCSPGILPSLFFRSVSFASSSCEARFSARAPSY